ncbi:MULTISPECIES: S66 peptidase family protein [Thermomonosporaceae]|uniref:S66 peptidase family protein n=1 Tax=Thermomonosporaceae TaxID=2012 RepID=UPI00255A9FE7|nr:MULTISPECIES: LD-carboxypeptidase [Thermomonosporaceae]MDL4777109.1 LD-carboxypeptidase [Actinomadura xylanilytica]
MSGGARAGAVHDRPVAPGSVPRRFARLRPGDRVAVVAPSGPADPARLEAGCAVLRDLGLDVTVSAHVLDRTGLGGAGPVPEAWQRLAGTDADRAADLQAAWCDPGVRAVICARGGYGATRVLDHLDWPALAAATGAAVEAGPGPKALHGSSDITALHAAFGTRLGITTSFGPMPAGRLADLAPAGADADTPAPGPGDAVLARTLDGLRAVLFKEEGAVGTGPRVLTGTHALRPGRAEAVLTGGNLSLLAALLGTPYAPPPAAGRVVFLEDVAEAPYRIDRMLTQLLQAGWFDGAAGVALGSWTRCGDPAEVDAVLAGRLGPLGVPILAGVPAGHGPCQRTLELGVPVRLDAGALTLEAPGGVR